MYVHCLLICYIFPKLAIANGVLTALYKGPCLVSGNVARAARKICLSKCV